MFTDKTSLASTDIVQSKEFLKCMSFDDASKVASSDIFMVFKKIPDADLSWSAVRNRMNDLKFLHENKTYFTFNFWKFLF